MIAIIVARTVQLTAAIVSATLLTAFVTVLPVPAQSKLQAASTVVYR